MLNNLPTRKTFAIRFCVKMETDGRIGPSRVKTLKTSKMRLPKYVATAIATSQTCTNTSAGDALSDIAECVFGSVRNVTGRSVLDVRAVVKFQTPLQQIQS